MTVPDSLPQQIYVLAHDPAKGRVRVGTQLGAMLRAAALADLYRTGHLTDDRGRAVVAVQQPSSDPVLAAIFDEVAGSRPRKWPYWIGRRQGVTVRAVRQRLGDGGWARLEERRILGLFRVTRVTMRDPRVRKELLGRVNEALKKPIGKVDPAGAAIVTVVAAGGLKLVIDRRTRRSAKRRIADLAQLSGPIGPALHRAIQEDSVSAVG